MQLDILFCNIYKLTKNDIFLAPLIWRFFYYTYIAGFDLCGNTTTVGAIKKENTN